MGRRVFGACGLCPQWIAPGHCAGAITVGIACIFLLDDREEHATFG